MNPKGLESVTWEGAQSALDPEGPQAERIGDLWWDVFVPVLGTVMVLVLLATLYAILRRRRGPDDDDGVELTEDPLRKRRYHAAIIGCTAVTALTLIGLLVASVATGKAMTSVSGGTPMTVELIGHQWWWEVRYPGAEPALQVIDANEIHIPVGVPVRVQMRSDDVIHSFWVPRLHGKKDLIPGHPTETLIRADHPGIYRGQCAEFCGPQHAKMALFVIAQPPEEFEAWLQHARQGAPPPMKPAEVAGQRVFMSSSCPVCHTIAGTPAGGGTGPNLTHVASRLSLGAGSLPNTRGHMAGWILDSQGIKPGNYMPPNALSGDDLQALLAYLESLR